MTTENMEIKVKATVDDASFSQAKRKVKGLQDDTSKAFTPNKNQDIGLSMRELQYNLEQIRGLQFADIVIGQWDDIKEHAAAAKESFKAASDSFVEAGDLFREYLPGSDSWNSLRADGQSTFQILRDGTKTLGTDMEGIRDGIKALKNGFKELKKAAVTALGGPVMITIMKLMATIWALNRSIRATIESTRLLMNSFFEAQKIGLDLKSYQEWAYIMETVGVGVDRLSDFMKTLADEQNAVRDGSEDIISAFNRIGLSAQEVSNMTQSELFTKTVEGLQAIENQVERTSLAYRIFGEEDAAHLTNILNLNSQEMEQLIENFYLLGGAASDSLIKKSSILQGSILNLRTAWTGLKNTLAEQLAPILNWVVVKLTQAIAIINMFLRAVFGFSIIPKSTASINTASKGVGGYTSSVKDATKAVEQLKRTTMGFDELNIVSKPSSGGSGSDGGAGDLGGGPSGGFGSNFQLPSAEDLGLEGISKWFEKNAGFVQFITILTVALGALHSVIKKFGLAKIVSGLQKVALVLKEIGVLAGVGLTSVFTPTGLIIAGVVAAIASVLIFLKRNWEEVTTAIKDFFNSNIAPRLKEIKELLVQLIPQPVLDFIVSAVKSIGDIFEIAGGVIFAAVGGVITSAISVFISLLTGLLKAINGVVDIITGAVKVVISLFSGDLQGAVEAVRQIKEGIIGLFRGLFDATIGVVVNLVNDVIDWFVELWDELVGHSIVPDMVNAIIEWFRKLPSVILGVISDFVKNILTSFKNLWNSLKEWFLTNVAPKFTITYWKNKFSTIKDGATSKIEEAVTAIKDKWNGLKQWFNTNITPKFTTSYWKGKFDTIASGARSAFNSIIAIVEKAINGIISKINTLSWKIPDWVPKYGGNRFGFNFSQVYIPRLATGGIATDDTLAHIGEGGFREAVLPLDRNTQWMDSLADKLASKMGGSGSAPTKVVLAIDGRELGWATINNINAITKQTGDIQLVL